MSSWIGKKGLAVAGLCALGMLGCGGSGGSSAPKNKVTVSASGCPSGGVPSTTCQTLEVQTAGNSNLRVDIRISEPDPTAAYMGTVVLSSGGGGAQYYSTLMGGTQMILDLVAAGFRVVERKWEAPWLSTGDSLRTQSKRYRELLRWIQKNVHTGGILCAVGNSGGAGEIAYTMTSSDAEDILDIAVLCSGPVFSRLDYLCLPPSAQWSALCPAFIPGGALTCSPVMCTAAPLNPVCVALPPGASATELENDSILYPGADLSFPDTLTFVLLGSEDCDVWLPQGLHFQQQIQTFNVLKFVPGANHALYDTAVGRQAILDACMGITTSPAKATPPPRVELQLTVIEGDRIDSVSLRPGELPATNTAGSP